MIDSILQIFYERYLFALMKMEKWFLISALFLLMDFTTLVINGAFNKAFKDFKETPKSKWFHLRGCKWTESTSFGSCCSGDHYRNNEHCSINIPFHNSRSLRSSKQKLAIHYICHRCIVWLRSNCYCPNNCIQNGTWIWKWNIFQSPLLLLILLIYFEEAPFTRLIEVENDEINYGSCSRKRPSCHQWMAFIGNGVNLLCSFILLTRVSKSM